MGADPDQSKHLDGAIDSSPSAKSGPGWISEDWAATIVGLALLILVLAGVIDGQYIP